ncbi:hypothetical protein TEA_013392 [Camellia sinensis var. sinensis]|uniref:ABC1 atypical kinase-like domain-containing protein n=1 Tax=Camellia sinensis var. sinensis TaxID=542762 RepID=A0A4S4D5Y4_CAMSN|nr:hypothetical protein TEA_013392 [Camellia sinensis var. sinensis]
MILVLPPCPFPANSNFTLRRRLLLLPPSHRRIKVLPPPSAAVREVDAFTEYSGYLFELSTSEVETLTEYDISKIASIYRNKPLVVVRRVVQVGATLGKWFALRYLDSVNERSEQMFEVRAAELRKILVQLGPAYIKIAQAISSRADLIPPSYLDELSLLQDQISPFSTEVAFNTIEQELGLPIDELFSEISPEPVAAASLGQVYQARLRPSGQVVAVKVQRPGVQAAISLDILILRFLAGLVRRAGKFNTDLQGFKSSLLLKLRKIELKYNIKKYWTLMVMIFDGYIGIMSCPVSFLDIILTVSFDFELAAIVKKYGFDLQAVVDEWASSLFREMDYKKEALNGLKFRLYSPTYFVIEVQSHCLLTPIWSVTSDGYNLIGVRVSPIWHTASVLNFQPNPRGRTVAKDPALLELYGGLRDVFVPEMYVAQTTRRVLTMQWVEVLLFHVRLFSVFVYLGMTVESNSRNNNEFQLSFGSTAWNAGKKLSEVKDIYLVEVGVYCSFNQLLECGFYHADPHPGNLFQSSDGKLAYLDFGMMGEFKQELRDGFIEACLHLVNRDYDALATDFVTLGLLPPTADKDAVTKALTGVFKNAVAKGVRNISFGDLLGNLGTTMYKFKFQIPSYFSLVIRSLAVLEGIAISFDPNYKVLGSTYPWIARKVLTDSSPKLKASLQALLYKDGVFRIDRLESLLTESLRARTEKKQVEDSDSRMMVKQILSFTLTEKGAFVREILLQEFAKGLDALGLATVDCITSAATAGLPFAASLSSSSMTEEDITNLRTFQRLVLLLSGVPKNESSNTVRAFARLGVEEANPYKSQRRNSGEEASLVLYQFASVQEILPLLSVILELPADLQQQVLRLPVDLTGKLMSRVAARTIRRAFL